MKALAALALTAALLAAGRAGAQAALSPEDQRQAVEGAADLLRRTYVAPELGAQAADRLLAAQKAGDYAKAQDPVVFAAKVTQDLQAATLDRHVAMIPLVAQSTSPLPRSNGGISRVERLTGDIGYLKLDSFSPLGLFKPFADEAMGKLAGTKALIVDLRDNSGGAASSVTYLTGFFFAQPTHVDDLITRTPGASEFTTTALWTVQTPAPYLGKPVYVLVGPKTFSGGEEFADALQAQKRAVVVGEATGGGANPGGFQPLIGGRLRIFVPTSRAENPVTKTNWQGSGVTPDLPAPAGVALAAALRKLRADPAAAVEARLMPLREVAQSGSEAALRKLIAELAAGDPDYSAMEPDIAAATKRVGSRMQSDLARLGAVQSVRFRGVGDEGGDEYDVTYANGAAFWMIYRTPEGRLAAFGFNPSR